ncbi:MAG: T9SS C-terminal target domain-containing protein [Cryomorphaceae bacterium]|nr:MAG: T9SS C-terminal target domain-containing protein [Cryomorphaceae bacterium]
MAGNEVVPVNFNDYFSINITSVGVSEYGRDFGLSAFPNPVQSGAAVNLKLSEPIDRAVVQLLSATGQTMWQRDEARMEAGLHVIPMAANASGMYFLRIQTPDSSQIIRIAVVD